MDCKRSGSSFRIFNFGLENGGPDSSEEGNTKNKKTKQKKEKRRTLGPSICTSRERGGRGPESVGKGVSRERRVRRFRVPKKENHLGLEKTLLSAKPKKREVPHRKPSLLPKRKSHPCRRNSLRGGKEDGDSNPQNSKKKLDRRALSPPRKEAMSQKSATDS